MNIGDKEDLIDILDHDGYKLMLAEMETIVRAQESKVLQYNLTDAASIQQLAIEKARAEGSRNLLVLFTKRMSTIRPTKK